MPYVTSDPTPWDKFKLLMWKNLLQQWRHRVQTFVEFLMPILTMSLLLFYRSQVNPYFKKGVIYSEFPVYDLNTSAKVLSGLDMSDIAIVYSPQNDILEDIVSTALAKMFAHNIIFFPEFIAAIPNAQTMPFDVLVNTLKDYFTVRAYRKSAQLKGIYASEGQTRLAIAAVEFSDAFASITELPKDISYTLRFPERPRMYSFYGTGSIAWFTDRVLPVYFAPGPRCSSFETGGFEPGYAAETFLALQYLLSNEIIMKITGTDVSKYEIKMKRFPHHRWTEDDGLIFLQFVLGLLMAFSYSYTAINIVRAIVVEKEKQLKEHMKMMGLATWLHWAAWFWKQVIYLILSALTILIMLKYPFFRTDEGQDYSVLVNTSSFVLLFFITLYMISTIFFCFLISGFFSKASSATLFTGIIWFMSYIPSFILSLDVSVPHFIQLISCLFINSAISFGFNIICAKEAIGGIKWPDVYKVSPYDESGRLTFREVIGMLIFDSFLFLMLALYLEQVLPGPFGSPRPWYFCLKREYWQPNYEKPPGLSRVDMVPVSTTASKLIKEEDPTDLDVGLKIRNLTKVFGKHAAVNNVTMNLYYNQITALLGHNGAGKTTTMSMICGNLQSTRGTIILAGYNMKENRNLARKYLGFCPQHNVLFDDLTVREHLKFYASLKGLTGPRHSQEVNTLITKLELRAKANTQSKALSGGQKRRLQVGIALCGDTRVVLLDEPTSGMDPASRRALWDLLQKEKKNRAMILSTHFMDEADILGDRIAILANGTLICIGTPYFLKQYYGVGYTLVLDKGPAFNKDACTNLIKSYVPDVDIKEETVRHVAYTLPNKYTERFSELFEELEENRESLDYEDYGLSATTLEDVFMRVGADLNPRSIGAPTSATTEGGRASNSSTSSSDIDGVKKSTDALTANKKLADADTTKRKSAELREISSSESTDKTNEITNNTSRRRLRIAEMEEDSAQLTLNDINKPEYLITGRKLLKQQIWSVWKKLCTVWTRSRVLVLMMLLIPILSLGCSLCFVRYLSSLNALVRKRKLALDRGYKSPTTILRYVGSNVASTGSLAKDAYENHFNDRHLAIIKVNDSIDDYYLNRTTNGDELTWARLHLMAGAEFTDDSVTCWFSNFGYHDIVASLAEVQTAILKSLNPSASLQVYNHPLHANYADQSNMQVTTALLTLHVGTGMATSVGLIGSIFVMFYIKERMCKALLLQESSGIKPLTLWLSTYCFDLVLFLITFIPISLVLLLFDVNGLKKPDELGRLFLIYLIYGLTILPVNYVFSKLFTGPAYGVATLFFGHIIFGNRIAKLQHENKMLDLRMMWALRYVYPLTVVLKSFYVYIVPYRVLLYIHAWYPVRVRMMFPQIVQALEKNGANEYVVRAVDWTLQFHPHYAFVTSVIKINQLGMIIWSCLEICGYLKQVDANITRCTIEYMCKVNPETCCVNKDDLWQWKSPGILRYIACIIITGLVFWAILLIYEYKLIRKFSKRVRAPPALKKKYMDEDVLNEKVYVDGIVHKNHGKHILVADRITKYYKDHLAVNQVSFTVDKGDCFGLLGINGAGKTTTFKMLMGDESISHGDAYICQHSVKHAITKVYRHIGYCPQFDALFDEFTGRETLEYYCSLRGIEPAAMDVTVDVLGRILGFTRHLDKQTHTYSGGNKRKLSTAIALIGDTSMIFVDEPTTGVDAAAKRQVWSAIQEAQRAGRGVVLTSHSMEECEALCTRLTIMVAGQYTCLGTPQHLKNKFSQGLTLTIKLDAADTDKQQTMNEVKKFIRKNFKNFKIMEEYQGMVTYYLQDKNLTWADAFGIMEEAKSELYIEDYTLSQTTLEQIFLRFTKFQKGKGRSSVTRLSV